MYQCAIPSFEGLLPEPHNQRILRLLFTAAHWHGVAKLRLHNDLTLDVLDSITESLGDQLREFRRTTCTAFVTRELEKEYSARIRHENKRKDTCKNPPVCNPIPITPIFTPYTSATHNAITHNLTPYTSTTQTLMAGNSTVPNLTATTSEHLIATENVIVHTKPSTPESGQGQSQTIGVSPEHKEAMSRRRLKTLNLNTYKFHSLGDYASTIRMYGTTDSYTTEVVSMELQIHI